jgi:RimJ/RimL family protein N-acetyltransferase
MQENIYSRRLNADDWEIFRETRLGALKKHPDRFGSTFDAEIKMSPEDWQKLLATKEHVIFGLFDEKNLIGISACFVWCGDPEEKTAILAMWYLHEAYRGQNLFVPLLQKTIDAAESEKRFRRIIVEHREGNEASRKTNQKLGFKYTHSVPKTWPDGVTEDEVFYERIIEG